MEMEDDGNSSVVMETNKSVAMDTGNAEDDSSDTIVEESEDEGGKEANSSRKKVRPLRSCRRVHHKVEEKPTRGLTLDHMEETSGGWVCKLCEEFYEKRDSLRAHVMRAHIKGVPARSSVRSSSSADSENRGMKSQAHDYMKQTPDGWVCKLCEDLYVRKEALRSHVIRSHISGRPRRKFFSYVSGLGDEVLQKSRCSQYVVETESGWKCSVCQKLYTVRESLMVHIRRNHLSPSPIGDVLNKQDDSESSSIDRALSISKYREFIKKVGDELECGLCGREYPRLAPLRRHLAAHFEADDPKAVLSNRLTMKEREQVIQYKEDTDNGYKCKECGIEYVRWNSLRAHIIRAHFKKSFDKLMIAPKKITKNNNDEEVKQIQAQNMELGLFAASRFLKEEEGGQYCCLICGHKKTSQTPMVMHLKVHIEGGKASDLEMVENTEQVAADSGKCKICDEVFTDNVGFNYHVKWHLSSKHPHTRLRCRLCSKVIFQHKVSVHMKVSHGQRPDKICSVCETTVSAQDWPAHRQIHKELKPRARAAKVTKPKEKRQYLCDQCAKCLATRKSLIRHMRLHVLPRTFSECPICHKAITSTYMELHLKRHERPARIQEMKMCEYCGKEYKTTSGLNHHIDVEHRGTGKRTRRGRPSVYGGVARKYSCEHCPKVYKSLESLKYHLNWHAGVKPYVCDVCNKGFYRECSLRYHKVYHLSVKPYQCKYCEKRFSLKRVRFRHECTHTGHRPYGCDDCGKRFIQKWAYTTHRCKARPYKRQHGRQQNAESSDDEMDNGMDDADPPSPAPIPTVEHRADTTSTTVVQPFNYPAVNPEPAVMDYTSALVHPHPLVVPSYPYALPPYYIPHQPDIYGHPIDLTTQMPLAVAQMPVAAQMPLTMPVPLVEQMTPAAQMPVAVQVPSRVQMPGVSQAPPATHVPHHDGNAGRHDDQVILERLDQHRPKTPEPEIHRQLQTNSHPEKPPVTGEDAFQQFLRKRAYGEVDDGPINTGIPIIVRPKAPEEAKKLTVKLPYSPVKLRYMKGTARGEGSKAENDSDKQGDKEDGAEETTDTVDEGVGNKQEDTEHIEVSNDDTEIDDEEDEATHVDDFVLDDGDSEEDDAKEAPNPDAKQPSSSTEARQVQDSDSSEDEGTEKGRTRKCKTCGKLFPSITRLKEHVLIHEGLKPFLCTVCNQTFRTRSTLTAHSRTHTGERPYKCEICEADFRFKSNYNRHVEAHDVDNGSVCHICGKEFNVRGSLIRHMHCHNAKSTHECTLCDAKFSHPYSLKKHMVSHSDDRPYICSTCGNAFKALRNLRRHELIHQDESERLPCSVPHCTVTFRSQSDLNRHVRRVHSAETRPMKKCRYCPKAFRDATSLLRHEGRHVGSFRFPCPLCEKGFDKRKELARHVNMHRKRGAAHSVGNYRRTVEKIDPPEDESALYMVPESIPRAAGHSDF